MTPLGWLGRKTSTQTKTDVDFTVCVCTPKSFYVDMSWLDIYLSCTVLYLWGWGSRWWMWKGKLLPNLFYLCSLVRVFVYLENIWAASKSLFLQAYLKCANYCQFMNFLCLVRLYIFLLIHSVIASASVSWQCMSWYELGCTQIWAFTAHIFQKRMWNWDEKEI